MKSGTWYEYYPPSTGLWAASGQVSRVSRLMPTLAGGTQWVVLWEACSAGDYNDFGVLECRINNPGTSGQSTVISTHGANPPGNNLPMGLMIETEVRDAANALVSRSFTVTSADGRVLGQRRDTGASTGIGSTAAQVSRSEVLYHGDPTAPDETTCNGTTYKRSEYDSTDTLVSETEYVCDTYGRTVEVHVRDGAGNLDKSTLYEYPSYLTQQHLENFDRPIEVRELTENGVYALTAENDYRDSGELNSSRRNWWFQEWNNYGETQSGAEPAPPGKRTSVGFHSEYYSAYPFQIHTMNHFEYDAAGRLKVQWGGYDWNNKAKTAEYTYDADNRVVVEDLVSAAQEREYVYNALGQKVEQITKARNTGDVVHHVQYTYDVAGRLESSCSVNGAQCDLVHFFAYDTKNAAAGPYNVGSRTITLTDTAQMGRLAYAHGDKVTQLYEYDDRGRVTDVVQVYEDQYPSSEKYRGVSYEYTAPGALDQLVYPSGRRAVYFYGADKNRPSAVAFDLNSNGLIKGDEYVVSEIVYSADGKVMGWTWGPPGSGQTRTYERLALGWPEAIEDNLLSGTYRSAYTFDEQWYPLVKDESDTAPGGKTHLLTAAAGGTVTRNYGYHPKSAQLRSWTDRLGRYHLMNNRNPNYTSLTEHFYTAPGGAYLAHSTYYPYAPGQTYPENENKRFGLVEERVHTKFDAPTDGEVDALDYLEDGVDDVELDYGPLGNVIGLNVLTGPDTGYITNRYDTQMRRIVKEHGLACGTGNDQKLTRWVYGLSQKPLVEENLDAECGGSVVPVKKVSEYVYVAGLPVGVAVTYHYNGTVLGGPYLRYIGTDRQGVMRKTFDTNGTLLQRLVMEPYGEADLVQEAGDPKYLPTMNYRYAGQYYDEEASLIENRWRYMIPKTHNYTAPDPRHRSSQTRYPGPQMYSYASWNPLLWEDPEGMLIFSRYSYNRNCQGDQCSSNGSNLPDMEEAMTFAMSASEKPDCKAWWTNRYPTWLSLRELLDSNRYVLFGQLDGSNAQVEQFGARIRLDCHLADGEHPRSAASSLIHELIHYADYQTNYLQTIGQSITNPNSNPQVGPEVQAYTGENECSIY